jgi:hypothetical protein
MKEKDVEAAIRDYARSRDVLCLKFVSPGSAGVPDRVLIGRMQVAFLEVKRPGCTLRPLQRAWVSRLNGRGVWCGWVSSIEEGKAAVDAVVACSYARWREAVKL